ncbi:hypothetical protein AB0395_07045 [Streptosporangium sp. NPDC051023]|uniref:anthranilate phosphoribosyltransferase n=1 Tax=Streptosporangium sp. NPDC051023 TaxID=3155410 RepID=UPI00344B2802
MHEAIATLLDQRADVDREAWRSLWDRLDGGGLDRAEATALLASLATRLPRHETLRDLVASLRERRPEATERWPGSVNIVGTGGGPRTFNISTASAFVAAAMGVRVVKTGSRAYTSSVGSIDLLERLGVGLTTSHTHTGETLDLFGIAFAGHFVYPVPLIRLARAIAPIGMRPFGRFLNALGPFLAVLPVTAQVTGVSQNAPLPELRRLAETITDRRVWLCANDAGADELLSFADNVIYANDGSGETRLPSGTLTGADGTLDDLLPAGDPGSVVGHFLDVVSGTVNDVATRTVCLNAASLAVAAGHMSDWHSAITAAEEAMRGGAARALVESMRVRRHRPGTLTGAVTHG